MSTANFNNNQLGFPLYVRDDYYSKVCPECGCWNMETAETCEDCGENLENVEARYDELENEIHFNEVQDDLRRDSMVLRFFNVKAVSGYYSGVQFDVDWKDNIGDPEELDNDDAHYFFGCCRSQMLRKYQSERRTLAKRLKQLADLHGFEEIVCVGVFSNGEAIYRKAEPPKNLPEKQKYAYRAKVAAKAFVNA